MADRIQLRRDIAANWTTANPVLSDGEIGIERDTNKFKIGNGTAAWAALAYGGLTGPTGPTGPPGTASAPIAFAFGDASPRTLITTAGASLALGVSVTITTPFNGASPSLQIGIAGQTDLLFPATSIDLAVAAEFEVNPNLILGAAQAVLLTLSPGAGATQGAGRIVFDLIPST